jgi:restriction endonuclease S subunit
MTTGSLRQRIADELNSFESALDDQKPKEIEACAERLRRLFEDAEDSLYED